MTQQGPEAILLTAAAAGRRELRDYTRLEYSLADAVRIESSLLRDFEAMPTSLFANLALFRRGAKRSRHQGPGTDAVCAETPSARETCADTGSAPSLAALPGLREERREGISPLSLIPRADRA
ncbi:MAG: hypothetical protein WCB18_01725 [Thermoplasmata archaeon]